MKKFKQYEAIVFDPSWWDDYWNAPGAKRKHPLKKDEVVYYLGKIPNVTGHCIVATLSGKAVPMVHPQDFRKAKEEEL